MDTSILENIAEDRISHELQKNGLLVAKPKSDQSGTDLLVFAQIADGVKFCRIQAKGRSFGSLGKTNVTIPSSYVTNGFVIFLYLKEMDSLYVFFPADIQQWSMSKNGDYTMSLSETNVTEKLEFYKYDLSKINLIKTIIEQAEILGEFRRLVYGYANIQESGSDTMNAHGEVSNST